MSPFVSQQLNVHNKVEGVLGYWDFGHQDSLISRIFEKDFSHQDYDGKITIIVVKKRSLVNLKFTILVFIDAIILMIKDPLYS